MKPQNSLLIGTIITLVVAMTLSSSAQRIVHVPFNTPRDSYLKTYGNDQIVNREYYYPQIDSMGATHAHEWHYAADSTDHDSLLQQNHLALFTIPGVSSETFRVHEAMFPQRNFEDEFWPRPQGDKYENDFIRLDTALGTAVRSAPPANVLLYFQCDTGIHNPGHMFFEDSLMLDFGGLYQRKYGVWLEIFKVDNDNSNTVVCSLRVNDPGLPGQGAVNTTFIIRANDLIFDDWSYAGGFINTFFMCAKDTSEVRVSLYWTDQVSVRFRKLRFMDEFQYRLRYDPNKQAYWDTCRTTIQSIQRHFRNDNRVLGGLMIDEPEYTTWKDFGYFRDSVESWIGNDRMMTFANFKRFSPYFTDRSLDSTRNPINMFDNYTFKYYTSTASYDPEDSTSLQYALDLLIDYDHPDGYVNNDHAGFRTGAEAAAERGIPFWFCMQTQGELSNLMREPTPAEILCEGFLAMSFGVKGFMYYHYFPYYNNGFTSLPDCTWIDRPAWRGAVSRGLTDLWQSSQDSTIESIGDLNDAVGNNGVLVPNAKWYAVKEFIDYVRLYEPIYANMRFGSSECAADEPSVDYVTIDSAYIGPLPPEDHYESDAPDETYVQIGVFQPSFPNSRYFMLVNRRCAADEGRWISITLDGDALSFYSVSALTPTQASMVSQGFGERHFNYYLPPGTGRLFAIWGSPPDTLLDNDYSIRGDFLVNRPMVVTSTGTLTILPGSRMIFDDMGTISVYGKLRAAGKSDSLGDSTITFLSLTSARSGLITLTGSATDTLAYCKFTHLDKGLKIVKDTGKKAVIDHCEFSYNASEGLYVSGGEVKVTASAFRENGGDGAYLYNCKATLDSLTVSRNEKNGLYLYSVNSSSTLKHSTFAINGRGADESPDANLRIYNCSPTLERNSIMDGAEFGIYGVNGSYPVMTNSTTAANTIGSNASHETYWNASYPYIDYGHNNFDVADDTLIYIENLSLGTFYARGNYWGGGEPNTGGTQGSISYYGPGTFSYLPYDGDLQQRVGNEDPVDLKGGGRQGFGIDDDDDAQDALRLALEMEAGRPVDALDAYRQIIRRWGGSPAAPLAVERMLWLVRNLYEGDVRRGELGRIGNYFQWLADTSRSRALAWKARRAALWALAAQHRYDEAIAGFEAIIDNADCRADSVFAVIDAGTLHLEAQEWAQ
ncbi:MAG: right-handed parallel beta-helix repeat-containing protein, partial [Calditrichaeota bacterium]|nr:right-handed parallel beta-helix repeat-containing protein [Calditrichota bacterium]